MDKLSEDEKYNLLLQSRCSTLIESLGRKQMVSGASWRTQAFSGPRHSHAPLTCRFQAKPALTQEFQPLYDLLSEMTSSGIRCTTKTFSLLVDAASLSRDHGVMQRSGSPP